MLIGHALLVDEINQGSARGMAFCFAYKSLPPCPVPTALSLSTVLLVNNYATKPKVPINSHKKVRKIT